MLAILSNLTLSKMRLSVMLQVLALFWRWISTAFINASLWSEFSLVILELDNGWSLCIRNTCRLYEDYAHFCKAVLRKGIFERENSAQVTGKLGACYLQGLDCSSKSSMYFFREGSRLKIDCWSSKNCIFFPICWQRYCFSDIAFVLFCFVFVKH